MSRIANYRRISLADYPEAPAWFERLAEHLNQTLDQLVTSLQGRLTTENESAEIVEFDVKHLSYFEFKFPTLKGTPEEVTVIGSAEPLNYFWWYLKREGTIRAICSFVSATTEPVTVTIKVRGQ